MNKPAIMGSVTLLLGVGIVKANDPCGVVEKWGYCSPGFKDGIHCYLPSTKNDGCDGVLTNFCIPGTLTCNFPVTTYNSTFDRCDFVSAAGYTYVTYTQGGACTQTITSIGSGGGGA